MNSRRVRITYELFHRITFYLSFWKKYTSCFTPRSSMKMFGCCLVIFWQVYMATVNHKQFWMLIWVMLGKKGWYGHQRKFYMWFQNKNDNYLDARVVSRVIYPLRMLCHTASNIVLHSTQLWSSSRPVWYGERNVVETSNGYARMTWNPKFECIYFIRLLYKLVVVLVSKGKWNWCWLPMPAMRWSHFGCHFGTKMW
jgi:hypothetical protein